MSNEVDSAVAALKALLAVQSPQERKQFAAAISGCFAAGELTSVGDNADKITSLSAAATAEEKRVKLTPLQAANATPNGLHLVKNVMSRAARSFSYTMRENEKVDLQKLDECIKASREKLRDPLMIDRSIEDAIGLKTDLAKLGIL